MWHLARAILKTIFILISGTITPLNFNKRLNPLYTLYQKGFLKFENSYLLITNFNWTQNPQHYIANSRVVNSIWDILGEIDVSYIIHPKFTNPKLKEEQY